MDPKKAVAEWLYHTVFQDEPIRSRPAPRPERIPSIIRTARSLENGAVRSWQTREALFLKQGKLLAGYEDDYDYPNSVTCYYPTYQALTVPQLRGYFTWRTRLRRGEVGKTSLSFAFLYIYELINQIGVADPGDGYRKLVGFRDIYGPIDGNILSYLDKWLADYVIYYDLDRELLSGSPQVMFDRSILVLEHIRTQEPAEIIQAVRQLAPKWLERSRFYAEHWQDMDTVLVRVLRKVSGHYDTRCKKPMVEQYFGPLSRGPVYLFDAAVFCDPLRRRNYEYTVDEQRVYTCKDGLWYAVQRDTPPSAKGKLEALVKTVDAVMRKAYDDRRPVKAGLDTKWLIKIIEEETQALLAEQRAAEAKKVTIDYAQLTQIRRDADLTQEKLIVDGELDEPALPQPEEAPPAGFLEQLPVTSRWEAEASPTAADTSVPPEAEGPENPALSPAEYRLLQCLLYGGELGWVSAEGHLLSVLVDGVNEKLYDMFLDTVLDDGPQVVDDYIDDLKEMVHS